MTATTIARVMAFFFMSIYVSHLSNIRNFTFEKPEICRGKAFMPRRPLV